MHGIQHATGNFVIIMDADMSHHVKYIHQNRIFLLITLEISQSILKSLSGDKKKEIMMW